MVTEGDVADDGGESGDEDIFAKAGLATEKLIELGIEFAHAVSIAEAAGEITKYGKMKLVEAANDVNLGHRW
jgi:hypothetical protein